MNKTVNPTMEEIASVLPGRSHGSISKCAKRLREMGYSHMTPQLLRKLLRDADHTELAQPFDEADALLRQRNAQTTSLNLRRQNALLLDRIGTKQDLLDALAQTAAELNKRPPVQYPAANPTGTPMTVEVLVSDLQIGKLQPGYNTAVARKRLFAHGQAIIFQIRQKLAAGYNIERIVLGLLGDIIESDKKHKNSARATDTGTAQQMYDAQVAIFEFIVEPLARLGIKLEVICVPGNHDWDDHGMGQFRPGVDMLSYPLYAGMAYLCKRTGYDHVEWDVVPGSYAVTEFYGQYALYEHGVGVSVSEASMKAHKIKRSEQEKKHLTYFRMGDKHNVSTFNAGQFVVNGAYFGSGPGGEEYSSISGYSSVAAQWMGFHVPRKDNRLTLYDTFTIQLEHIGEE